MPPFSMHDHPSLQERILRAEPQLKGGGITYQVTYLGHVPINTPVHEMSKDVREGLIRYILLTVRALSTKSDRPAANKMYDVMCEEPKLKTVNINLTISSETITAAYNDPNYPTKMGYIMRRHPIKLTSLVKYIPEVKSCFAYISKKNNNSDRRCCVFMSSYPEARDDIVQTLEEAIEINNRDTENRETPIQTPIIHSREPSSGAATPTQYAYDQREALKKEPWFHGPLNRGEVSARLKDPGDYLVRTSENNPGQYILSIINEDGRESHTKLLDEFGNIPANGRVFCTVSDFINAFHGKSKIETLANSDIFLRRAVKKPDN